jgi:hypothetical protein
VVIASGSGADLLQYSDRLTDHVEHPARKETKPEHPSDTRVDAKLHGPGHVDWRKVRCLTAPINRAHNAKVIIKRHHHPGQCREREAIIPVICCSLLDDGFEQQEFSKEARQRGNACQRKRRQKSNRPSGATSNDSRSGFLYSRLTPCSLAYAITAATAVATRSCHNEDGR